MTISIATGSVNTGNLLIFFNGAMRLTTLIFTIFGLFALSGCLPERRAADSVILARVGDDYLTLDDALNSIPPFLLREDSLSALQTYQSGWIEGKIKQQEAHRLELDETPLFQERTERFQSQLLQQSLHDFIIAQNNEDLQVSRDEAHDYYLEHREQFVLDERFIRFRHLTTRTRVDAENARTDLMRGIPWTDVADRYSVNPSYQIRESESFFPVSVALSDIPVMHDYLERIGVTEISPVHDFAGQYHFVQLIELRDEGEHPDLEWLLDQITEWLRLEKTQRVVNTYIRNLYLQAEANNEIERADVETVSRSLTDGESSRVN